MNISVYIMIAAIVGLVIWRRTRSMYRPMTGKGIRLLVPIFFILPGMLIVVLGPDIHFYLWEWVVALAVGAVLSIPLIWTTNYEIREDRHIYARKSTGFVVAFIAVVVIRIFLQDYLSMIDTDTKTALFMVVAVGYVVPWRIVSYMKFRELYRQRTELA